MRKEYGKLLSKLFTKCMKEYLPDFKESRVKSMYLAPGERAFKKSLSASVCCWVVLGPSPKGYDEFTILLGWSKLDRYPELTCIPSMESPTQERKEFRLNEYLIRLPQLYTSEDKWWVIEKFNPNPTIETLQKSLEPISEERALAKVLPLISDAMTTLNEVGVNYLNEFEEKIDDMA